MNRNNISHLIIEREQELKLVKAKLEKFVSIRDKIVEEDITGLDLIKLSRSSNFPNIVIEGLNLKKIGDCKIKEDIAGYGQKLIVRLKELINMYQGSAFYLEDKISQLSNYINKSK